VETDRLGQSLLSCSRDGCHTQSHGRHAAVQNMELLSCGTPGGKAESKGTGHAGALDSIFEGGGSLGELLDPVRWIPDLGV
jgi:hypothetical protein